MKRLIPVLIALVLMVLVGGGIAASYVAEKYSYSKEQADMMQYFHLTGADQAALILQNERLDEQAKIINGNYYFDYDTVEKYFNKDFYINKQESVIFLTTATEIITAPIGESTHYIQQEPEGVKESVSDGFPHSMMVDGVLYMSVDFVKKFSNFSWVVYTDPNRIQLYTDWSPRDYVVLTKDTQVRYQGGIKSDVLCQVKKGDQVYLLDQMDTWSHVKTKDGISGYVENKMLSEVRTEEPLPVTDYNPPEYTNLLRNHKINMAWHNVAGVAGNDTLTSYLSQTKSINVIAPTWFVLADNNGNLTSFAADSYVEQCHNMGIEVWAVVDNVNCTNPEIDCYQIFSNTQSRQHLVNEIMRYANEYHLDGINVDIEDISSDTGIHFAQFVRELSIVCRKAGVVLSIDNYVPIGNSHYHRDVQGQVADYVVIMGYDEHYAGSAEAGSVASINYVTTGIELMCQDVPAEKVINGIPFYTRIWETNGSEVTSQAVGMELAQEYIRNHGLTPVWDEVTQQNYAEYYQGNSLFQVWLEDAESIAVKLNVMKVHNIAGVAEWKLSFETPDVWDVIAAYVNGQ